jgi:predicted amidohydrolase
MAVPAQCAPAASSALIGPHGYLLRHASPDGPDVVCVDLDRTDADLDIALNKARPWRATARAGDIYATRRVTDARSLNRTLP